MVESDGYAFVELCRLLERFEVEVFVGDKYLLDRFDGFVLFVGVLQDVADVRKRYALRLCFFRHSCAFSKLIGVDAYHISVGIDLVAFVFDIAQNAVGVLFFVKGLLGVFVKQNYCDSRKGTSPDRSFMSLPRSRISSLLTSFSSVV